MRRKVVWIDKRPDEGMGKTGANVQRIDRLVVDVGCGNFFPGTPNGRALQPKERVKVYEVDEKAHRQFKAYAKWRLFSPVRRVESLKKSFTASGLPDESVDELHLDHVFTSRKISDEDKKKILSEARRVLKPGASAIVGNTRSAVIMPAEELEKWAQEAGFSFRLLVKDSHMPGWMERPPKRYSADPEHVEVLVRHMGQHAVDHALIRPGYYLAELTKQDRD